MLSLPQGVKRLPRQVFIDDVWTYEYTPPATPEDPNPKTRPGYSAGEHVSWLGPTGSGKTTFMGQLLEATVTPKLPAVVLAVKPRDDTMRNLARACNLHTVRSWPPLPNVLGPRPAGWVHWPKHAYDPTRDDVYHREQFRGSILQSYKRGNRILVADEAYSIATELNLGRELVTIWSKGRSMKCGLWAGTQKPSHVPLWMYSQAQHLFIAWDPDKRARMRLKEISGGDPDLIDYLTRCLTQYEWLYFRQTDRTLCVVGK